MKRSCQRYGSSLFLTCGKKPECPEKRTTASMLETDKPKQAALKLEGYTASSARLKFTQEPQRMHHRTTVFSARTPNCRTCSEKKAPTKKKSPIIDYIQIKR